MTQSNNEVKFKYYASPTARTNDQSKSDATDIAFVKTGTNTGEIYAKGYKFGQGTPSGDITVEDITAKSVIVNGVGDSNASSSNVTTEIYNNYVTIANSLTDEYIKFTTSGIEYMPENVGAYGSTVTATTKTWAALLAASASAGVYWYEESAS